MSIACSIRKVLFLGCALAATVFTAGCRQESPPPERVSTEPLTIDAAMQLRNWGRTPALYVNGGVVAGPTRFCYEPAEETPTLQTAILEPLLFPVQSIVLPFTYIPEPPSAAKLHRGAVFEPHHNLQMPLEVVPY